MSFETGIINIKESGLDFDIEWHIICFFILDDVPWFRSPEFPFNGERWRLLISPNGSSRRNSYGHVDLRLYRWSTGPSTRSSFSLSIKTAEGKKYNEQRVTKDFKNSNKFHHFSRFIPRTELSRRKSELAPAGILTVVCTMKRSTSAGSEKGEASNAGVNKSDVAEASGSSQVGTTTTKESEGDASKAQKNKSDVAEASGSSQAGTTTIKESGNPISAENCSSDSDSGESSSESDYHKSSSDSESVECCHKCPNCLAIVKKEKKFLEKLGSQKETSQDAQSLCKIYKKVLLDGRNHDLILKVGDRELRAHRDILRLRSRVFESMLDHDMKEKNTGVIDVPDCDPDAMQLFLSYVYCGKIESIDHSNMLGLYYIADKYEMLELKRECCNSIKETLSLTNICSVIQLALNHSDSELLEFITGYFAENMVEIMQTVEWQSFHKDNFTVGYELIIKSIKKLKNAQT